MNEDRPDHTCRLTESFEEKGYAVAPGILNLNRVKILRRICDELSEKRQGIDEFEIDSHEFLASGLATIPFEPEIVRNVACILGSGFLMYPNFTMRAARYTKWHIDGAFQERNHSDPTYLWDPGFRHAQCVMYLQDNSEVLGGGLDVIPGSHFAEVRGNTDDVTSGTARERMTAPVSIPSKAGDLIMFDGRLMHRGTPNRSAAPDRKYGIFWSASRHNHQQAMAFLSYLARRVDFLPVNSTSLSDRDTKVTNTFLQRYSHIADIRFPDSYPESVLSLVRQQRIAIAAYSNQGTGCLY